MVYGLPWLDSLRAIKWFTGCLGLIKRPSALIKRPLEAIKLAVNEPRFVSLHAGLDKTATGPASVENSLARPLIN